MARDLYPYSEPVDLLGVRPVGSAPSLISFANYDYLDLERHPRVREAARNIIDRVGVGATASRLVGGELSIHRELEAMISSFVGVDDALAMVSGYGANVALVSHLMTKGDLILVDESSHNSIMVGTQLSRADAVTFRHNDLDHLTALLKLKRADHVRVIVVVEGLYSMDGDIPDLPRLLEICRTHGAWLMVDEAHSIGVLGARGRGICEHFGVDPSEVDVIVGTLSKSFVTCGGFVCARRSVIDWLRGTLPGFVYSVGLPPPSSAASKEAIAVLSEEPERLAVLHDNSRYFLDEARSRGLNVGTAVGAAVIPLLFGSTQGAIAAGQAALAGGYYVPPIAQIAVPKDAPRLRCFVTARHTRADISGLLDTLMPFVDESAVGQVYPDRSREAPVALGAR